MDTQTINTPEKLHKAIVKFLESNYSDKDLAETYNDARKCALRFRGDYSALPALHTYKDNPLDGLQDIMEWCIESIKTVDDIVNTLERQTIREVISRLKELRGFADIVLSLVNSELREQAGKEARSKVEETYEDLNKKVAGINGMPLVQQAKVAAKVELKALQEREDAVQIYLSKDATFNNKLSQLHDRKINEVFKILNEMIGDNTLTGKLLDIYCKLKGIPLQQKFSDLSYIYRMDDLADVIFGNCSRLYGSVDNVIKTFDEIQIKAEHNAAKFDKQQRNNKGEKKDSQSVSGNGNGGTYNIFGGKNQFTTGKNSPLYDESTNVSLGKEVAENSPEKGKPWYEKLNIWLAIVVALITIFTAFTASYKRLELFLPSPSGQISIQSTFFPTGWIGDGKLGRQYVDFSGVSTIAPHSLPNCIRIRYAFGPNRSAGIYWQNKADNWGDFPGNDYSSMNLRQISFWARGEIGGEEVEFKAGDIKDKDKKYQDSFAETLGRIRLTKEWKKYIIDLKNKDLSSVIGGFCWTASSDFNKQPGITFYLDDIVFE